MTSLNMSAGAGVLPSIVDSESPESPMLPSQVVDFWIILLFWFVGAWAARIVHLTVSLKEVRRAIDAGQITVHRDVPLHSSISWLAGALRCVMRALKMREDRKNRKL